MPFGQIVNYATKSKCRDCGTKEYLCTRSRGRTDVCDSCYDKRLGLVNSIDKGDVSKEEIESIQKSMRSGRGKASKKIDDIEIRGNINKIREMLEELTKEKCWSDELSDDCIVNDFAGGNIDDAFYGGQRDGEIMLARRLIKMLDGLPVHSI